MPESPQAGLAGDYTELVAHLWAHVTIAGPGNAHDSRYVAWAHGRLDAEATALLRRDAGRLGLLWHDGLHRWSELHDDIASFRRTARHALADVRAPQVRDPATLAALQAIDGPIAELVHVALGLLAPTMQVLYAQSTAPALRLALGPVQEALDLACRAVPSLATRRVALVGAMGPRGRAMPTRILVGAPAPWNDQQPLGCAVLALHEHAVLEAPGSDYVSSEWTALTRNAVRLATAAPELGEAYAAWLASLDLRGLSQAAEVRGWVGRDDAVQLAGDPTSRRERLARLGLGAQDR